MTVSSELMLAMMLWVSPVLGLPVPSEPPRVVFANRCDIQDLVYAGKVECRQDSGPVAAYNRGTIYLPDTWDSRSLYDQSALLHELAHHVQHEAGLSGSTVECPASELEAPAYAAQMLWLRGGGSMATPPGRHHPRKEAALRTMRLNGLALFFLTRCEERWGMVVQ